MTMAGEDKLANEAALFFADAARVWLILLWRRVGWIDVGSIDARKLEVASDLGHRILDCRHNILQTIWLIRRVDGRRCIRAAGKMAEEDLELLGWNSAFAQLASHAESSRASRAHPDLPLREVCHRPSHPATGGSAIFGLAGLIPRRPREAFVSSIDAARESLMLRVQLTKTAIPGGRP
jgi:hypothetical protein